MIEALMISEIRAQNGAEQFADDAKRFVKLARNN
jgi:hypothetical protein